VAIFAKVVFIQVEADDEVEACDSIHELLEPLELEGAIMDWGYMEHVEAPIT
jgi:hypothetical protein